MQPRHSNLKSAAAGKLAALQSSDEAANWQALCAAQGHNMQYQSKFVCARAHAGWCGKGYVSCLVAMRAGSSCLAAQIGTAPCQEPDRTLAVCLQIKNAHAWQWNMTAGIAQQLAETPPVGLQVETVYAAHGDVARLREDPELVLIHAAEVASRHLQWYLSPAGQGIIKCKELREHPTCRATSECRCRQRCLALWHPASAGQAHGVRLSSDGCASSSTGVLPEHCWLTLAARRLSPRTVGTSLALPG